jgi:hypothetical protein
MILFLIQSLAPGDCLLTGLCGAPAPAAGLPSGIMFVALGLVLAGAAGLRYQRRRSTGATLQG